ncbi:NUDIX hydrolase [Corynebacterium callunae]|uniref:NUDIX hydrolase n=1 Tax=Corynebacterium callunae TaxID=1721 RepID=UPI0004A4A208|nr:NUDIX hydrolase [Corynebacterium callunae]
MSDLKPEGNTSGAPKRRRRRRSRRPSGQNQAQNQQNQQGQQNAQPAAEASTKSAPPHNTAASSGNEEQKPNRRRRSRRRGNRKSTKDVQQGQKQLNPDKTEKLEKAVKVEVTAADTREKPVKNKGSKDKSKNDRNRRKSNSQRRRPNNRVHQAGQQSRMVTSDETSAGGLVVSGLAESVNEHGEVDLSKVYVALIGRLDRRGRLLWSMPKGHVEPGEGKAATAEREVWEETGIHGEVFTELGVIDYWFVSEGKRIHKTVHHHLLRFVDGDLNDEDPEVTEVAWIPAHQLIEHLAFADERKLARMAHDLLPEYARKEKAEGRATPR